MDTQITVSRFEELELREVARETGGTTLTETIRRPLNIRRALIEFTKNERSGGGDEILI